MSNKENNNKDMVKLLLDMGSNPNLSNKQGQRPIDVCSEEDVFFSSLYLSLDKKDDK